MYVLKVTHYDHIIDVRSPIYWNTPLNDSHHLQTFYIPFHTQDSITLL